MTYNPWPLGQVPEHLQRPELKQLKEVGYKFEDPREVVDIFERKVAKFFGAPYAVAVDCCTHGIELCLRICNWEKCRVIIPKHTYISIPMMLIRLGYKPKYENIKWKGAYALNPFPILDAATLWGENSYVAGLQVISFQIKKYIPIGRGGMILTNNKEYYDKLKLLRYDGRDLNTPYDSPDHIKCEGFHYYMTPEDAARGILLMDAKPGNGKASSWEDYPNVKKMLKNINKPKYSRESKLIFERDGNKIFQRQSGCYEEREPI